MAFRGAASASGEEPRRTVRSVRDRRKEETNGSSPPEWPNGRIPRDPSALASSSVRDSVLPGSPLGSSTRPCEPASIDRLDFDLADPAFRIGGLHFGIEGHRHFSREILRLRRTAKKRSKSNMPALLARRGKGEHGSHRELRLMDRLRVRHRTKYVDRRLMDARGNMGHIRRLQRPSRMTCSSASAAGWV